MTAPSEELPVDTTIDPDIRPPDGLDEAYQAGTRRVVGDLVEEPVEEKSEPEPILTAEEKRDFQRLVTVGRRYKTVNVADFQVRIRTLKTGDELRIGLFTKEYLESHGFARAHQIAVVASGLVEIKDDRGNEQELWTSLKEVRDPDEIFAKNCDALLEFHPPVVVQIYDEIMSLEREFAQVAVKLGKFPG